MAFKTNVGNNMGNLSIQHELNYTDKASESRNVSATKEKRLTLFYGRLMNLKSPVGKRRDDMRDHL